MHARETIERTSSLPGMPAEPGAGGAVGGPGVAARCWQVARDEAGGSRGGLADLSWDPWARSDDRGDAGTDAVAEACLQVLAAGFNYKDALACAGHPGVMRRSPLVPGIDAAGVLLAAAGPFPAGSQVLVTGNGMGESRDGGFATHLRMPVDAILPLPAGLTCRDAMAVGTAGLTVVLACDRLDMLVSPRHGAVDAEWLVTGASGGVGMLAVAWLAAAGRRVVACSRKETARETLLALGATAVVRPEELIDPGMKSLSKARWGGVVETVGGTLLAEVLRAVRQGGAVAAIGMAGGAEFGTTVHPFILRGVTLAGIDAAALPTQAERRMLWQRLAAFWPQVAGRLPVTTLGLAEVGTWAEAMLRGATMGRAVVLPGGERDQKD